LNEGQGPAEGSVSKPQRPSAQIRNRQSKVVRLQFLGANEANILMGGKEMPGKVNYIAGKDPAQWHTGVPTYGEMTYSSLYPGINLTYSGTGGQLKGTYTLAPNANPSLIRWQYAGAENVAIDPTGNLQITVQSKIQDLKSKSS